MDFLALGLDIGIAATAAVLGFVAAKMMAPTVPAAPMQPQPAPVAAAAPAKAVASRPYATTMEERRGLALGAIYIETKLMAGGWAFGLAIALAGLAIYLSRQESARLPATAQLRHAPAAK